jgi:hypothetical protein
VNFAEVEREVAKLRQDLAAGRLTEERLKDRLRELMVEDTEGNWWMVGYETGEWYRHDGTDWVPDQPPDHVAPRPIPTPPAQPVALAKPKLQWFIVLVLGLLITFAVGFLASKVVETVLYIQGASDKEQYSYYWLSNFITWLVGLILTIVFTVKAWRGK